MALPENQELVTLTYGCTPWRRSSQDAFNLYNGGSKLWKKTDLRDIEGQLSKSEILESFKVRLIDGKTVLIANPIYGERNPVWQPRVQFQEYWRLVKTEPDRPPETYHCSYLVDWVNISARTFGGVMEKSRSDFEVNRLTWNKTESFKLLSSQLEKIPVMQKVTKVICFGLGDMFRKPPEWMTRKTSSDEHEELEASLVHPRMVQHSIALTIAQICRDRTENKVQLLAQDPDYTEESKQMLQDYGFSIVGQFGAGGFAEVDDHSVVFSVFVEAPLKQIIADIARPQVIISTGFDTFNDAEKPWVDAESPRTEEMWKEYDRIDFPISPEDEELMSKLRKVYIYIKKEVGCF